MLAIEPSWPGLKDKIRIGKKVTGTTLQSSAQLGMGGRRFCPIRVLSRRALPTASHLVPCATRTQPPLQIRSLCRDRSGWQLRTRGARHLAFDCLKQRAPRERLADGQAL